MADPGRRWRAKRADASSVAGAPAAAAAPAAASGASADGVFVVWHKCSDLRLADHEPAVRAHAAAAWAPGGRVLHLHLLEAAVLRGRSRVAAVPRCGARRAAFWRQSAEDLAASLAARGQALATCADGPGGPAAFFERLCREMPVRAVFAHQDFCDEEIRVSEAVRAALSRQGAALEVSWGGLTVHHINDLGFDATDKARMPEFKGQFLGAVRGRPIRKPLGVPTKLSPAPTALCEKLRWGVEGVAEAFVSLGVDLTPPPKCAGSPQGTELEGGETAVWRHVQHFVWDTDGLPKYKGATESFNHGDNNAVNAGTRLSPWLAFGCITARAVMEEVRKYERVRGKPGGDGRGKTTTTYRLYKELIFRDFLRFSTLVWKTSLFKIGGPFGTTGLEWRRDQGLFDRWREGQTGFPFVDAGMRELAATGYMSHLHRQCCAAFLVRDLRLDWRMGAEHFEACLVDYTPDANWGNWAYRILQRPCLVATGCPVKEHATTLEVLAWPVVHDARLEHTLAWLPELRGLPPDLAREPWRTASCPRRRIEVKPYRDSPQWFCSANRATWQYEYAWLPGHAWTVKMATGGEQPQASAKGFRLGRDYPEPIVPPLNVEVDYGRVPVDHAWGGTPAEERPHTWGRPGRHAATCTAVEAEEGRGAERGARGGRWRQKAARPDGGVDERRLGA